MQGWHFTVQIALERALATHSELCAHHSLEDVEFRHPAPSPRDVVCHARRLYPHALSSINLDTVDDDEDLVAVLQEIVSIILVGNQDDNDDDSDESWQSASY